MNRAINYLNCLELKPTYSMTYFFCARTTHSYQSISTAGGVSAVVKLLSQEMLFYLEILTSNKYMNMYM